MGGLSKYILNPGDKFNKLTFLRMLPHEKGKITMAEFECECGETKIASPDRVVSGALKSCSCLGGKKAEIGEKHNKLKLVEIMNEIKDGKHIGETIGRFECECGGEITRLLCLVRSGGVKTCGCSFKPPEIGEKHNYLTLIEIIEQTEDSKYYGESVGRFECVCGRKIIRPLSDIRSGHKKSCGCKRGLEPAQASFNNLLRNYKNHAKDKNREFALTIEEFKILVTSNCFYCNIEPSQFYGNKKAKGKFKYNGIDRICNNGDYNLENCVPCCKICNWIKWKTSQEDFLEMASNIRNYNLYKNNIDFSYIFSEKSLEEVFRPLVTNDKRKKLSVGKIDFNGLFRSYKNPSKKKGLEFELSEEQFLGYVTGRCFYCASLPQRIFHHTDTKREGFLCNGIDRIDNKIGYKVSNCVTACARCNFAKRAMSQENFIFMMCKIADLHDPLLIL